MELTLSVNNDLAELLRLLDNPCGIFLTHLGKGSHHLLSLTLVQSLHGTRILRVRILDKVETVLTVLTIEGIACLHVLQLHGTTNITSIELINRLTVGTSTSVELSKTLLRTTICIRQVVTSLHSTTHYLEIRHLTNMRLHTGLEEIKRGRTIRIRIYFLTAGVVNLWHFAHKGNHITQEFHQTTNAHRTATTNTEHGEDAAGYQTLADTFTHLVFGE